MTDSKQPLAQPTGDAELDRSAAGSDHDAGQTGQLLDATTVFRDVTDQTVMRRQLEVADRLASLGTVTSGISHEISNPLAIVMANAGYVRGEIDEIRAALQLLDSDRARELAGRLRELSEVQAEISSASSRISKIVADLKVFARPALRPSSEADIARAIGWAVRTTAHEFRHRARLTQDVPVVQAALADETRLGQVIINLLRNAAQVITPGRANDNEVVIRARTEQRRIIIEVRDTGPGIPPDDLQRIFEPFFTTKPPGEGAGLGLSVCQGIVTSMGGEIQVESELGKGTTFRVILRGAGHPSVPPPLAHPARASAGRRRGRILLVDDDVMIHRTVKRLLREHEVVCADSGACALAILERGEAFDVVLSDLMMPNMTGMEFYDHLAARHPDVVRRVVFVTGGALATVKVEGFLQSIPNITLEKPFGVHEMQALVARMLGDGG